MSEHWYRTLKLKMTIEQFRALPRNPAYKYEYLDEMAWLTPRPKQYHAKLDLTAYVAPIPREPQRNRTFRRLEAADWEHFPNLFSAAFIKVLPFSSLDPKSCTEASRECLEKTRTGGDGPLIEYACIVATGHEDRPIAAALVTITPEGDLEDAWSGLVWREPPPEDWLTLRLGRPHLTWIFVPPGFARYGLGSALLSQVVHALLDLGYAELVSTFLLGNDASTLWHWRNGFGLAGYPGTMRVSRG